VDELTTSKAEIETVTELLRGPRRTCANLLNTKLQITGGSLEEVLDIKGKKII